MGQLEKILDYFIEYEWESRLANITLNKRNYINITREQAKDEKYVKKCLMERKKEKIQNVIEKVKFVNPDKKAQVKEEVKCLFAKGELNCENMKAILSIKDYQYKENYVIDIEVIRKIIQDNQVMVLFPVCCPAN